MRTTNKFGFQIKASIRLVRIIFHPYQTSGNRKMRCRSPIEEPGRIIIISASSASSATSGLDRVIVPPLTLCLCICLERDLDMTHRDVMPW